MADISQFSRWENFYVIVGSSAGALIGLQFVVMTLISESQTHAPSGTLEVRAFGTPTVVHFCATLLIAGIISAPWHSLTAAANVLTACSLGGLLYSALTVRHAKRQTGYKPDAEDWLWYAVLPLLTFAVLLAGSLRLRTHPDPALFLIATGALALLFLGIHNSWDTVTYVAISRRANKADERDQ